MPCTSAFLYQDSTSIRCSHTRVVAAVLSRLFQRIQFRSRVRVTSDISRGDVTTVRENTTRPGVVQAYAVLSAESVTDGHPAQDYFRGRISALRGKLVSALGDATGHVALPADLTDTPSEYSSR